MLFSTRFQLHQKFTLFGVIIDAVLNKKNSVYFVVYRSSFFCPFFYSFFAHFSTHFFIILPDFFVVVLPAGSMPFAYGKNAFLRLLKNSTSKVF